MRFLKNFNRLTPPTLFDNERRHVLDTRKLMQLSHYITPQEIIIPLKGTTKDAIYKELVRHIVAQNHLKDKDKLVKAIQDREASASTFLPMGIAIPHARISNIKDIIMAMGVTQLPIKDTIKDSPPMSVNVFCMFFSPTEEKEFGRHLKLLARIAAIFSDTKLVPELVKMKSPDDIFERIQRRERELSEE